jgi:hypothetical protein
MNGSDVDYTHLAGAVVIIGACAGATVWALSVVLVWSPRATLGLVFAGIGSMGFLAADPSPYSKMPERPKYGDDSKDVTVLRSANYDKELEVWERVRTREPRLVAPAPLPAWSVGGFVTLFVTGVLLVISELSWMCVTWDEHRRRWCATVARTDGPPAGGKT